MKLNIQVWRFMSINVIGKYVLNPFNMMLCIKKWKCENQQWYYRNHLYDTQNISLRFIKIAIRINNSNRMRQNLTCYKQLICYSIFWLVKWFVLIRKFEGLFYHIYQIWSKSEAILHLSYQLIITDYTKNEPCRNNHFFCNMCVFYARSLPENKRIRNRFSFIFCWWRITSIWGNQRFLLFVMLGQQKKF